jgi:hypothetical protein
MTEADEGYEVWRTSINGYEMIPFLAWLLRYSGTGLEPLGSSDFVACTFDTGAAPLFVNRRNIEPLQRMGLIDAIVIPARSALQLFDRKIYRGTAKGEEFLKTIPNEYLGGEPAVPSQDDEEKVFWTVIVKNESSEAPQVFPWIARQHPDPIAVLSAYHCSTENGCNIQLTGPHSIRFIPPSAFAFDVYPMLVEHVGPRIVRSWFDTVLNPLLDSLALETSLLMIGNWTWRVPPRELESIRVIRGSTFDISTDNLEQFLGFYPNLERAVARHDEKTLELRSTCEKLHRAVVNSLTLRTVYLEAKEDDSLTPRGTALNAFFAHGSENEQIEVFAQCVVNGADQIPAYYTYSAVWAKYGRRFLASLEDPEVKSAKEATNRIGEELLQIVNDLIVLIKARRARLSLRFDVPIVTTQPSHEL